MINLRPQQILEKVRYAGLLGFSGQDEKKMKELLKHAAPCFKKNEIKFQYFVPCIKCGNIGKDTYKVFSKHQQFACTHSICLLCLGEILIKSKGEHVVCPCQEGKEKIRNLCSYIKQQNDHILVSELFTLYKANGVVCRDCGQTFFNPEELYFAGCTHIYCKVCVSKKIIDSMKLSTKIELCCHNQLTNPEIESVLTEKEFKQFIECQLLQVAFKDGVRFSCPCLEDGFSNIFLVTKYSPDNPECKLCHQKYCMDCQQKMFDQDHKCPEFGIEPKKGSDLFFYCPGCKIPIGRSQGGFCVRCQECNEYVCTICRLGLGKDFDFNSHFIVDAFTRRCEGMKELSLSQMATSSDLNTSMNLSPF